MEEDTDLIWIQDAITKYRRSREWFNKQIRAEKLEAVGLPGDAKVYLRRSQLKAIGTHLPCKVAGCDGPAHFCGMCGRNSCEQHGHALWSQVPASDPFYGLQIVNWICNDCSDRIAEAFQQHPPQPLRLF